MRYARPAIIVVALVPVAVLGLLGFQLLQARQHLTEGAEDVHLAAAQAQSASFFRGTAGRDNVLSRLVAAQAHFDAARRNLFLWGPVLAHLGWIPGIGSQLEAAPFVADGSYFAARAADELLLGLEPVWPARYGQSGSTLPSIAPRLAAARAQFSAGAADADRAVSALAQIPRHTGNRGLDSATATLRHELPRMRNSLRWLVLAPVMLGNERASRYLIVMQDPRELRATGGFIGAVGVLTVKAGHVSSTFSSSAFHHEIDSVPPPAPEALYTPEGPWIFRDANWSPNYPESAKIERWFYGRDTGRWVDGVISVQDTTIVPMLRAIGPVYVPQYHTWVNDRNVQTLAERYVNANGNFRGYHGPSTEGLADSVKKQFLGWTMAAVLRRMDSLSLQQWMRLSPAVSRAVAARDIVMFDRRPAVESAVRHSGADGSLGPAKGDFLAIVDDNRSYNKLNPYVQEDATYSARVLPDLTIDARLAIHYHVRLSPADLEGLGPGYGAWGTKHDYQDFVRVYVPAGAQLLGMSGADKWAPAPAFGLTQLAGRFIVRAGQNRTVVFHYRMPRTVFAASAGKSYRLMVRRQAGSTMPSLTVRLSGESPTTFSWEGRWSRSVVRTLPLEHDAVLHVEIRHGDVTTPRFRPLSRSGDPYLPYRELRAQGFHG